MSKDLTPLDMNREFRPEKLPRRGEYFAWGTALIAFSAWTGLRILMDKTYTLYLILGILLLLTAIAISLGNWMDRHTRIRITDQEIYYENGLRKARLAWHEIQQVQVFSTNLGRKVRVIGAQVHFDFRTLGEVKLRGETKGTMGFGHGEQIFRHILKKTGLKEIEKTDKGDYYARE